MDGESRDRLFNFMAGSAGEGNVGAERLSLYIVAPDEYMLFEMIPNPSYTLHTSYLRKHNGKAIPSQREYNGTALVSFVMMRAWSCTREKMSRDD